MKAMQFGWCSMIGSLMNALVLHTNQIVWPSDPIGYDTCAETLILR